MQGTIDQVHTKYTQGFLILYVILAMQVDMDIDLARTFLAVVETGSFVEAARRVSEASGRDDRVV